MRATEQQGKLSVNALEKDVNKSQELRLHLL
jgi:hypothetical protein